MKSSLFAGAVGVAIAVPIGYYCIYLPQQKEVTSIRAQIASERANQRVQTEVAGLMDELSRHYKRLPSEPDSAWLAREIVKLSQEAGLQLTSINQETSQPSGQLTRLTVNLQFAATYHQVGAFVDRIERAQPFILVNHVDVVPSSARQGGAPLVRMSLSTIYVPSVLPDGQPQPSPKAARRDDHQASITSSAVGEAGERKDG